jgi:thiamine-phosphate pyrophosphorylase
MSVTYDLYVITDEGLSKGHTHAELARMALAGGADVIQLRDKNASGKELLRCALEVRELTEKAGALFIVNDRLDVALACRADGVHLGQDDLPVSLARKLCPPGFIIGASAGTMDEALQAEQEGADYVGLGPVFCTTSKGDAGPACGLGTLKAVKDRVSIPVIAIGGIGPDNAADAIRAGADGLAVISAVVSQDDVELAARSLKALIQAALIQGAFVRGTRHRKVDEG